MEDIWNDYFNSQYKSVIEKSCNFYDQTKAIEYLHLTGLSLVQMNRVDEGKKILTAASVLCPRQKHWFCNAAVVLHDHDPQASYDFVCEGIKHFPDDSELYFHKGNALNGLKDHEQALEAFNKSIELKFNTDALLNKANCLRKLDNPVEALKCYEQLLEIDPDHKPALLGKSMCFIDSGKGYEAMPMLEKIVDYLPEASFIYGIFKLSLADFENGWKYYKRRWECGFAKDFFGTGPHQPLANSLEELKDKRVALIHEQGNGDTLQFMRFIPYIKPYVGELIVCAPDHLKRIIHAVDPTVPIIPGRPTMDRYDLEIPMIDQAFLLGINLNNIPNRPYIPVNTLYLKNKKPKVGLCWAGGNLIPSVNKRRSLHLKSFLPLKELNVDFVSLQLGPPKEQLKEVDWDIETPLNEKMDYMDTANYINTLDLIITVDTSVAHVAGGIGKKTWMLSRYDACWRWLRSDRTDTPWYPTMKIYRQPPPLDGEPYSTDWESVIDKIKTDLKYFIQYR